jgi:uncharacterized protein (TIGR02466 family)
MFPQPLMVTKLENHDKHKKNIIDLIGDSQEVYPFRNQTNGNVFKLSDLTELKKDLTIICQHYFNDVCGINVDQEDFFINSSWLNNFRSGLKLVEHAHRNSHISGCYYINYDQALHPPLQFKKQNKWVDCSVNNMVGSIWADKVTEYNKNIYTYTPNEGEVCMFNSNIPHQHVENQSSVNRISLAFNCVLKHYRTGTGFDDGRQYEIFIKEIT